MNGRIRGVLLCLLLMSLLGGVAFAARGVYINGPITTSPSGKRSDPPAHEQGGGEQRGAQPTAHTGADCTAETKDIQTILPAADQATGLAHAIRVVEGNCENNVEAPGLVVAFGHLMTNYRRHLAHEADKAAGVHGNSADHGAGATRGRSGQHGPPSQDPHD